MSNYHFQKRNELNLDETIRLDGVVEKVKEYDDFIEDDLGNEDDYLHSFESEKLDRGQRYDYNQEPVPRQRPRQSAERDQNYRRSPNGRPPNQQQRPSNQNRQRPSNNSEPEEFWTKKNIIIMTLVIVIIAVAGFFVSSDISYKKPSTVDSVVYMAKPMLIQSFLNNGQIVVYDINEEADVGLSLTSESEIYYSGVAVSNTSQFSIGDIVMISANDKKEIVTLDTGKNVVDQKITSVEANTSDKKLTTINNGTSYNYHDKTLFLYNGKSIEPSSIHYTDEIVAKSYNGTLWIVEVVKSHGYFDLSNSNNSNIQEGRVQINNENEISIDNFKAVTLAEGTHNLIVTGKNIETIETTFTIEPNKTYSYNLSLVQEKQIVVLLQPNVSDYELYVDGILEEDSSHVILPMGTYDFKITKEGYKNWEEVLVLENETINLKPELELELVFGTAIISSNEIGSAIYVDNEYYGDAPLDINLQAGKYVIKVVKEGFVPYTHNITMGEDSIYVKALLEKIVVEVDNEEEFE